VFILLFGFQEVSAEKLVVGTIERPPFVMQQEDKNLTGFSIDLMDEIASRVGLDIIYGKFETFGNMIDTTLEGKKVDMSISNITITQKRELTMDYSQPIYASGLQIMIPKNGNSKGYFRIIWESGILWFIVGAFVLLLIIAHIVWFFEKNVENPRHDYFRDDYIGGVWDAFRWAFIIMTMGGFENEVPYKKVSRFVAMIWIVVSLFLVSSLTANITTSLTINELSSDINGIEDLNGKTVGAMRGPTVKSYLTPLGIIVNEFDNSEELYNALKNKKVDAVVGDAPIIQYHANGVGKRDFSLVGNVFKPESYGILFPEASKYKEKIDQVLLEIQEDGTYQKIHAKYFGK
ncbi:transporter substrate-binding domain-containing protein, partial [Candidatus Gracilibacteria bacterium]|nr:transporter substrate-binding domain-containing protein [Candidatus Gracilibacteria bacterium]